MSAEKVPSLNLNLGDGKKLEMTPENSTLYTFMGMTAIGDMVIENSSINHVFVATGQNERGQATGMYFFNEFDSAYSDMARHMTDHRYPMVLNQRNLAECDLKVWMERVEQQTAAFASQIPDAIPEK